jgi:hypothetical protein
MPSVESIKAFLAAVVVPVLSGAAATWLVVHVHFLALFHLEAASIASMISQVAVFGITAGLAWLTAHHVLSGHYTPAAKAGAGR